VLANKQENLLERLKIDLGKKTALLKDYEKIIAQNTETIENQLAQIANQSKGQTLVQDTFDMQLKQLATQNSLLKEQVRSQEERNEEMKK
jgi:hypothetical protein